MNRDSEIKLVILRSLSRMPAGYAQPDASLVAEVCLAVCPRPTLLDVENALTELELMEYIAGTRNELTGQRKWRITDAGKLALANV